jgi:hypothetical protein
MTNEAWHSVWERKGSASASKENHSEDELFAANGYDTPLGVTSVRSRRHMLRTIAGALKIAPHKLLLDVGCGSGAMLSMLRDTELQLSGVDFSASLVKLARRSLKDADIRTAEAARSCPSPPASSTWCCVMGFSSIFRISNTPALRSKRCSASAGRKPAYGLATSPTWTRRIPVWQLGATPARV